MSSSPLESGVGQRRQAKSDSLWRGLVFSLHQPPLSHIHHDALTRAKRFEQIALGLRPGPEDHLFAQLFENRGYLAVLIRQDFGSFLEQLFGEVREITVSVFRTQPIAYGLFLAV